MSWTDERIKTIKDMWLIKGMSATQIAKAISGPGATFSRNAVIGKLHRLGISARGTPSRPAVIVERAAQPPTSPWADKERADKVKALWIGGMTYAQISAELKGVVSPSAVSNFINRQPDLKRVARALPTPDPKPVVAPSIAAYERRVEVDPTATSLTIGAHMCRWPIGDPSDERFGFCGRRSSGGSYCVTHARVAFVPQTKKTNTKELIRSTRRFT